MITSKELLGNNIKDNLRKSVLVTVQFSGVLMKCTMLGSNKLVKSLNGLM